MMNRIAAAFAIACAPFVVVACCSGVDDPDTQLQVEVKAPAEDPSASQSVDDLSKRDDVCGATVVAYEEGDTADENGIALEEARVTNSDGSEHCVYRGAVDPAKLYVIEATLPDEPDLLGADSGESNPACSTRTDPNDTDATLALAPRPEDPKAKAQQRRLDEGFVR